MNYRELQAALKGHTSIKLNSKASVLQAEYERLFLNGESCVLPLPVATQQSESKPITNTINDQAGGNYYKRPVLKGKVNAQKVSEVKRQASQAPRLATTVKDKYINKRQVNEVRQQQIKGSSKKVECKFNKSPKSDYFVNDTFKKFEASLGTTERQALANVTAFGRAVVEIAKGFHQAQVKRNAA